MNDLATSPSSLAVLACCLLLTVPLAGCLEPIGEATQDALTDPDSNASASESRHKQAADGEESSADEGPSRAEVADTYQTAFSGLEPSNDGIERFSTSLHSERIEGDQEVEMKLFVDVDSEIAILSFVNGTHGEEYRPGLEELLLGVVHKTSLMGSPAALMGEYNESHSWSEIAKNLSEPRVDESSGMDTGGGFGEASLLFGGFQDVPPEALSGWEETTYEGREAREVQVQHDNETTEMDLRVVIDRDTQRPLALEGVVNESASLAEPSSVNATFAYGEEASHPYRDELVRLEAMTIESDDDSDVTLGASVNETLNYTVQPSANPGSIPLEEVTVQLRDSVGQPEASTLWTSLPAEEGELTTENATLAYVDHDDDGRVSPGDEIRFTPHTEEATRWDVVVEDEQTGMRLAPGPSLVLTALALVGLAAASRRGDD